MKVGEVIQRIMSNISGVQSDVSRLRRRHVYNKLMSARHSIIEERLNRNMPLSSEYFTVLDFQVIEEANISDNELYPLQDCGLTRTSCKLPTPLIRNNEPIFKYVTSVDGKIIFDKSNFYTDKYANFAKYSAKIPRFFFKDGYLYFVNSLEQKLVRISYIIDDLQDYVENDCLHPDECIDITELEFPAPDSDIDKIVALTIQELQYLMRQTTEEVVEIQEMGGQTQK